MSDIPSETPHTIEAVGKRIIQAIENQTKAMDHHSKIMMCATYTLAFATIILAIVTVAVRFYP